ncbi:MAG: nucleotidyltransferase family protein [Bacilli bacterium]|jgi:molybdenum cofactor cytidylyltransferase
MAEGIILSGGLSSRAYANKMLFIVDGKPLIIHAIEGMKPFVKRIIVVTGRYHDEINNLLKDQKNVVIAHNKDYEKGMFSSVLTGVRSSSRDEDFFILPGDCPFVKVATYRSLLKGIKSIRVPVYNSHHGHPMFISKTLKAELLKMSVDDNLKAFRNNHDFESVEVDDPNILVDIDTRDDYEKILHGKDARK